MRNEKASVSRPKAVVVLRIHLLWSLQQALCAGVEERDTHHHLVCVVSRRRCPCYECSNVYHLHPTYHVLTRGRFISSQLAHNFLFKCMMQRTSCSWIRVHSCKLMAHLNAFTQRTNSDDHPVGSSILCTGLPGWMHATFSTFGSEIVLCNDSPCFARSRGNPRNVCQTSDVLPVLSAIITEIVDGSAIPDLQEASRVAIAVTSGVSHSASHVRTLSTHTYLPRP